MKLSGLASGLDVDTIVTQLMNIERAGISKSEFRQQMLEKKSQIYSDIKGRIENLENFARELTYDSTFDVYTTSYSEESIISAVTSTGASTGSYNISVSNLARAHTVGTDKQTDSTTALGISGDVKINGCDIALDAGYSLENIRDQINDTDSIGVRCTIVDNVLRIKSVETGSGGIIFEDDLTTDALTSLGILDANDEVKNEFTAGQDAVFTVDGQEITSSTNSIDAIEGMMITLLGEGSVDFSVSRNADAIISKIKNFINQYNSVVEFIHQNVSERKVVPITTNADRLKGLVSGDMMLYGISNKLKMLVSDKVDGLEEVFDQLSGIGISKNEFSQGDDAGSDVLIGKINIDESILREAILNDIDKVTKLFNKGSDLEGISDSSCGIASRVYNYLGSLTGSSEGLFAYREDSIKDEIKMIESRIKRFNETLELREANLRNKYLLMELALSSMDTQSAWLQQQLIQL